MTELRFEDIRQKVLFDACPVDVFDAYVDPRKHAAFTDSPATGSPRVGRRFTAWGGYISGKYIELVKGEKNRPRVGDHRVARGIPTIGGGSKS